MRKMLKVMLTEDGSETLHELAGILRSNNCEVSTVIKDGTQIVEKLKSGEMPDVLLMDGFMSRLDALGVLRELDAMRLERRPMVMVLSSADNQRFEGEVLRSGADYYFLKPYNPAMLAERIVQFSSIHNANANSSGVKDLEVVVSQIMHQIGVPAHIRGYQYLREAVRLTLEKPEMINRITKELYPTVARRFGTSSSKVERAIRHAIEVAWGRGRIDVLDQVFGPNVCSLDNKPTNGEFIALVAGKLSMDPRAAS